jgi:hypothetical protein
MKSKVTSQENVGALPGVNVVIKGTTLASVTYIHGNKYQILAS